MKFLMSGENGFIGSALRSKLYDFGMFDAETPREADFYFHFGSPSSNILFDQKLDDCIQDTVGDFLNVCRLCRNNHIKLIYPSSATIYNANTSYSHTKRAMESIQNAYDFPILNLRIFAGYGVGEGHKKHYSSVINQWIDCMLKGERPVVYGDGKQTRDFVYIDDIVDSIVSNLYTTGIIDIGTGINTSFNEVVSLINKATNQNLKPIYIDKPSKYLENTSCESPRKYSISVESGIDMMLGEKC